MPDYPVGPQRSDHAGNNAWFLETRAKAVTVPCPFCHAPANEWCVNGDYPLRRFPAHDARIRAARKTA